MTNPPQGGQPGQYGQPGPYGPQQPGQYGQPGGYGAPPPGGYGGQQPPPSGQPQPGQYGPPYGGQPYGQPAYGAPQYGQPPYGAPQYGQPPSGPPGPPYGQPPESYGRPRKTRTGRVSGLVALAVLLILAVVLSRLLGDRVLDRSAVERNVAEQFERNYGVGVELTCPQEMVVENNAVYRCTGVTADGEEVTVEIRITDPEDAEYEWDDV